MKELSEFTPEDLKELITRFLNAKIANRNTRKVVHEEQYSAHHIEEQAIEEIKAIIPTIKFPLSPQFASELIKSLAKNKMLTEARMIEEKFGVQNIALDDAHYDYSVYNYALYQSLVELKDYDSIETLLILDMQTSEARMELTIREILLTNDLEAVKLLILVYPDFDYNNSNYFKECFAEIYLKENSINYKTIKNPEIIQYLMETYDDQNEYLIDREIFLIWAAYHGNIEIFDEVVDLLDDFDIEEPIGELDIKEYAVRGESTEMIDYLNHKYLGLINESIFNFTASDYRLKSLSHLLDNHFKVLAEDVPHRLDGSLLDILVLYKNNSTNIDYRENFKYILNLLLEKGFRLDGRLDNNQPTINGLFQRLNVGELKIIKDYIKDQNLLNSLDILLDKPLTSFLKSHDPYDIEVFLEVIEFYEVNHKNQLLNDFKSGNTKYNNILHLYIAKLVEHYDQNDLNQNNVKDNIIKIIDKLIKLGLNINKVGSEGNIIHIAAELPDPFILEYFVRFHEGDLHITDKTGLTPLEIAREAGNQAVIDKLSELQKHGYNVDMSDAEVKALILAISHSNYEATNSLLQNGVAINGNKKMIPIHHAIINNDEKMLNYLIEKGAVLYRAGIDEIIINGNGNPNPKLQALIENAKIAKEIYQLPTDKLNKFLELDQDISQINPWLEVLFKTQGIAQSFKEIKGAGKNIFWMKEKITKAIEDFNNTLEVLISGFFHRKGLVDTPYPYSRLKADKDLADKYPEAIRFYEQDNAKNLPINYFNKILSLYKNRLNTNFDEVHEFFEDNFDLLKEFFELSNYMQFDVEVREELNVIEHNLKIYSNNHPLRTEQQTKLEAKKNDNEKPLKRKISLSDEGSNIKKSKYNEMILDMDQEFESVFDDELQRKRKEPSSQVEVRNEKNGAKRR